jgi:hypothetical protein
MFMFFGWNHPISQLVEKNAFDSILFVWYGRFNEMG